MAILNAEQRCIYLMHALGWTGGTIHQVAKATGCPAVDLLDLSHPEGEAKNMNGFSAVRTCSAGFFDSRLVPEHKGDLPFWLGVAYGQYVHEVLARSFEQGAACSRQDWRSQHT